MGWDERDREMTHHITSHPSIHPSYLPTVPSSLVLLMQKSTKCVHIE
jgi:hypothetical protein